MTSTGDKEYDIIRLCRDNLSDVGKLYAAIYGKAAAKDYFIRKYDTAFSGAEYVGFIAYARNREPAAYYGVIPCLIQFEHQTTLAAQSADTMTHPRHRYKGMFVELSNITFDLCRQLGIRLLFGFPNQNSYHGSVNKLGWKMTGAMECFTIRLKSLPLESISKKFSLFANLYRKYSRFILKRYTLPVKGVANSVLGDGFAGIDRSNEYLCYKEYSSARVIGIGGSKIWINNKYGLAIGDMEGVNEMNFNAVILELKKLAGKMGVRQILFHCSPGTSLHQLFAVNYEAAPSYPMLFQDFGSVVPPEKFRFTFADNDIF